MYFVTTLPSLVTAFPRVVTTCEHTRPLPPFTRQTQEKLLKRIRKLVKRIHKGVVICLFIDRRDDVELALRVEIEHPLVGDDVVVQGAEGQRMRTCGEVDIYVTEALAAGTTGTGTCFITFGISCFYQFLLISPTGVAKPFYPSIQSILTF